MAQALRAWGPSALGGGAAWGLGADHRRGKPSRKRRRPEGGQGGPQSLCQCEAVRGARGSRTRKGPLAPFSGPPGEFWALSVTNASGASPAGPLGHQAQGGWWCTTPGPCARVLCPLSYRLPAFYQPAAAGAAPQELRARGGRQTKQAQVAGSSEERHLPREGPGWSEKAPCRSR